MKSDELSITAALPAAVTRDMSRLRIAFFLRRRLWSASHFSLIPICLSFAPTAFSRGARTAASFYPGPAENYGRVLDPIYVRIAGRSFLDCGRSDRDLSCRRDFLSHCTSRAPDRDALCC